MATYQHAHYLKNVDVCKRSKGADDFAADGHDGHFSMTSMTIMKKTKSRAARLTWLLLLLIPLMCTFYFFLPKDYTKILLASSPLMLGLNVQLPAIIIPHFLGAHMAFAILMCLFERKRSVLHTIIYPKGLKFFWGKVESKNFLYVYLCLIFFLLKSYYSGLAYVFVAWCFWSAHVIAFNNR